MVVALYAFKIVEESAVSLIVVGSFTTNRQACCFGAKKVRDFVRERLGCNYYYVNDR